MNQVIAKKLDIRCLIEGFEVPCVTAATTINHDTPVACTFQCIPTPSATRLKARSSVHIFVKDTSHSTLQKGYRLFFMGEIIGYQFQKSPVSLSVVYQAVDDSSYWDTAYQYYTDYGRGADWLFRHKSAVMGTGLGLFDSVFQEHASVIGGLLRTSPKTYPQLKGLAGGVVHIIEAVGGIPGKFRGFNDFFAMAELRRNILAQISASEADRTSVRIYSNKVFWQWLLRGLSSAGSMVSVRDMIKLLFQYIFHNVVPNPIAKYDAAAASKDIRTSSAKLVNTTRGKKILKHLRRLEKTFIGILKTCTHGYKALLTETAVLLALSSIKGNTQDNPKFQQKIQKHTKLVEGYYSKLLIDYAAAHRVGKRAAKSILAAASGVSVVEGPIKSIGPLLDEMQVRLKRATDLARYGTKKGGLIDPVLFNSWAAVLALPRTVDYRLVTVLEEEYDNNKADQSSKLPPPSSKDRVSEPISKASQLVDRAIQNMGGKVVSWKKDYTRRARIHNQIFRPDVWFVSPPRCNIIFPEDYLNFQYSRNFLQEITRMEVTTAMALVGSNMITNSRYFAPNIQDITGKYVLQSAKSGVRLIMPHEIYTGILPSFEFMSEANIYAAKGAHNKAKIEQQAELRKTTKALREKLTKLRQGAYDTKSRPDDLVQLQEQIDKLVKREESMGLISYIQRVVNWKYFKKRFAARSMSLNGNYLYRTVLGFPGAVINVPKLTIDDTPPHFIGMVAGMSHHLTQKGGATSVSFSDSREHSGFDDEYLGLAKGRYQNITTGGSRTTRIFPQKLVKSVQDITAQIAKVMNTLPDSPRRTRRIKKLNKRLAARNKQLQFLKEYVERMKQGRTNVRGMKGPQGGTVVSVEPKGEKAKLKDAALGDTAQRKALVARVLKAQTQTSRSAKAEKELTDAFAELNRPQPKTYTKSALPTDFEFHARYNVKESFPTIRKKVTLPPEEQIYPPWLSPIYRNEQIGKEKVRGNFPGVYHQFFGCKSLTDDPGDTPASRKLYEDAIADPDRVALGELKPAKSIEEAIDELALAYKKVRDGGYDIQQFIDGYTYRPVASMEDILGSSDLTLDKDGKVVRGTQGFHSFAFGDFENLEGFKDAQSRLSSGRGKATKIARGLDTRRKKREAVLRYVQELNKGVGQLGG